jgi:hypothetical protein
MILPRFAEKGESLRRRPSPTAIGEGVGGEARLKLTLRLIQENNHPIVPV